LTPLWVWKVSNNKASEKFTIETSLVKDLVKQIQLHHNGGRVLFSGFSLHQLNGGHLAPLAYWTQVPLVASGYQHDKWSYVDVIPKEYRKRKKEGVLEYLRLMNVSVVVSNDKFWRKWFRKYPGQFEEVWKDGGLAMFKLKEFSPSYFYEGDGELISQKNAYLRVKLKAENAVLKFNYLDFLTSSKCAISGKLVSPSVNFIQLSNCPKDTEVIIKSVEWFDRFKK
jgi:hypothetical protein